MLLRIGIYNINKWEIFLQLIEDGKKFLKFWIAIKNIYNISKWRIDKKFLYLGIVTNKGKGSMEQLIEDGKKILKILNCV